MLEFLGLIFMMWLLFKAAGFVFRIFGRVAEFFLGIAGYLILGIIAVALLGLSIFVLPVILIAGIGGLIAEGNKA